MPRELGGARVDIEGSGDSWDTEASQEAGPLWGAKSLGALGPCGVWGLLGGWDLMRCWGFRVWDTCGTSCPCGVLGLRGVPKASPEPPRTCAPGGLLAELVHAEGLGRGAAGPVQQQPELAALVEGAAQRGLPARRVRRVPGPEPARLLRPRLRGCQRPAPPACAPRHPIIPTPLVPLATPPHCHPPIPCPPIILVTATLCPSCHPSPCHSCPLSPKSPLSPIPCPHCHPITLSPPSHVPIPRPHCHAHPASPGVTLKIVSWSWGPGGFLVACPQGMTKRRRSGSSQRSPGKRRLLTWATSQGLRRTRRGGSMAWGHQRAPRDPTPRVPPSVLKEEPGLPQRGRVWPRFRFQGQEGG